MSVTRIEKPSFAKQLQMCFCAVTSAANPGQLLLLKKNLFCQTIANVERLDGAGAVRLERTKVSGAGWRMIAANEQTNKQDSRRNKTEAMGLEMQSGQY